MSLCFKNLVQVFLKKENPLRYDPQCVQTDKKNFNTLKHLYSIEYNQIK